MFLNIHTLKKIYINKYLYRKTIKAMKIYKYYYLRKKMIIKKNKW